MIEDTHSLGGRISGYRLAVAAYRVALAVLVLVALGIQFNVARHSAAFIPQSFFSFFTNLSNLFGAGVFIYTAITGRRGLVVDLLRGAAVEYLAITGVVYALLLSGTSESLGVLPWVNVVVHEIMPVAVIVDWVIVPPSHRIPLKRAMIWLVFPIAFMVYSLIRGAMIDWYPYPFLDPGKVGGYTSVAIYGVCIAIAFVLIALAIAAAGNWLRGRRPVRMSVAGRPQLPPARP
jgi:hypothetical protein